MSNQSSQLHTVNSLVTDLHRLGVVPGDLLFIHSSFRSLGKVEGGAATVVAALEQAVGPAGLVLMPSFNLVPEKREETWNLPTTPSTVGYLTEFFRTMPGTVRSDHYSHSVAARGVGATKIVSEHLSREGMDSPWDNAPWGKAYGTKSPMLKAYARNGKVLMLGVNYHSSTYMHVVEVTSHNQRRAQDPAAEYYWINRDVLGAYWDSLGRLQQGKLGDADCRLFSIRDFVDTLVQAVRDQPGQFFKYWPGAPAKQESKA